MNTKPILHPNLVVNYDKTYLTTFYSYQSSISLRYLTGINKTAEQSSHENRDTPGPGCHHLEVLDLTEISLSLHTITLLLIHLQKLTILDHNHLHEALWLMDKTGMDSQYEN